MRKRQSFVLTVFSSENADESICGQLKCISNGKSSNFSCMEELFGLIMTEMADNPAINPGTSGYQYPATRDLMRKS